MKKVSKSQRNDSNGRILGKMRRSSAPSSQNPSTGHPNRSGSADTEPPSQLSSCLPAPQSGPTGGKSTDLLATR